MKKIQKLIFLILAVVLTCQTGAFALVNDTEGDTGLEISPEISGIIEDGDEPGEKLELSPLAEDFDRQESTNESPLNINYDYQEIRSRSMSRHIPSYYDLRDENRVSPVKDQGPNGSCWSFATYGSMESVLSKYGSYDFSEKHLRNKHYFDWGPNDGGNRDIATAYMASWQGPIDEAADPYDPVISYSPEGLVRSMDIDKVLFLPDVNNFEDTKEIKQAVMDYGGVYTVVNSSKYYENETNFTYHNPGGGPADHAVTIVGWDDNFSKNGFDSKPKNNGAWICKNSWGRSYMDNGYYYVSYEDFHAGSSNAVFIPKKKDPNGKIYQYDPLGATRSVGYNKKGYMANIFKAESKETLHEVGLYNVSMHTDYVVYLVRNVSKTSQLSNDRVEIARGSLKYPGYYTIDVDQTQLEEGEQFALVVYMDSSASNYRYPLPIEARIEGYSSKASSETGQSFVSNTGETWSDLSREVKGANACVKAITTTGEVLTDDELVPDQPGYEPAREVNNIIFNEGDRGFLRVNNIGKLSVKTLPEDIEANEIKIYTRDTDVVKVDDDGTITPLKTGEANIFVETENSRGTLRAKFYIKIIPKDLRFNWMEEVPVIGEQEIESEDGGAFPSNPYDPEYPDPPRPEVDETIPRSLSLKIPSLTLREEEEFDLKDKVMIYPETARDARLRFSSMDEDIAEIDANGNIFAKSTGVTEVKVMTENNLQKSIKVNVLPKFEIRALEIREFSVSDRSAGIFTITMKAEENGKGYSGPATIETSAGSDDYGYVSQKSTIYFQNGQASIKYNGGQFGVWRTNFESRLRIRDLEDSIGFGFSKSSKSPAIIKKYPDFMDIGKIFTDNNFVVSSFEVGERSAGIFDINFEISKDSKPYTGGLVVTTECQTRFNSRTVRAVDGKLSIRYNGAQFPVWMDGFETRILVDGFEEIFTYSNPN